MSERSLFRFLVLTLGIALVIVSRVLLNALDSAELNERSDEVRHSLLLLQNTETLLSGAESAARAFAFTGDDFFLEEYEALLEDLQDNLARFQQAPGTRSDDDLAARLAGVVKERLAILSDLVLVRQQQGPEAASRMVAGRKETLVMDRIRRIIDGITDAQIAALEMQRDRARSNGRELVYLLGIGSFLTLGALAAAVTVTRGQLRRSSELIGQLHASGRELSLVSQLNYSLQSCATHKDAVKVVRHYLQLLFPDAGGALYLMRASRNLLQLSTTWNFAEGEEPLVDPIEPNDCWALRLGRSQQIARDSSDMACTHATVPEGGGYVCVPMMAQSEIVGLLHLRTASVADLDKLREHAAGIGAQIAAGIASISLREQLHVQNVRDPLTNLFNRRYLDETMEREQLRARRHESTFGLIILDLDHFKQLNDSRGHHAGDAVLAAVGEYLRRHVRGDDIPCRYGGEEFVVVLPGATAEQTRQRAEFLRAGMENIAIAIGGQQLPPVTASFGVAAWPDHGDDWHIVLQQADTALYRAKREGRNRVMVAEASPAHPAGTA
jgi:diguanylate cyclase (GGDEF)-like protein